MPPTFPATAHPVSPHITSHPQTPHHPHLTPAKQSLFGKLALFAISGWAGHEGGGVIAGLGVCGIILSTCSSSAVLMQDFRTGYITLSSPRAMFLAQARGALFRVARARARAMGARLP